MCIYTHIQSSNNRPYITQHNRPNARSTQKHQTIFLACNNLTLNVLPFSFTLSHFSNCCRHRCCCCCCCPSPSFTQLLAHSRFDIHSRIYFLFNSFSLGHKFSWQRSRYICTNQKRKRGPSNGSTKKQKQIQTIIFLILRSSFSLSLSCIVCVVYFVLVFFTVLCLDEIACCRLHVQCVYVFVCVSMWLGNLLSRVK